MYSHKVPLETMAHICFELYTRIFNILFANQTIQNAILQYMYLPNGRYDGVVSKFKSLPYDLHVVTFSTKSWCIKLILTAGSEIRFSYLLYFRSCFIKCISIPICNGVCNLQFFITTCWVAASVPSNSIIWLFLSSIVQNAFWQQCTFWICCIVTPIHTGTISSTGQST